MYDVIFGNRRDVMSKKPKCPRYRHMSTRKVAPFIQTDFSYTRNHSLGILSSWVERGEFVDKYTYVQHFLDMYS